MNTIIQAFGDFTVGQVLVIIAGFVALWEAGKKIYNALAAHWKKESHEEQRIASIENQTSITLETINLKLNYIESTMKSIVKRTDVLIEYQKNASGREFLNLYLQAKDEMASYGCVILDTYDDMSQAFHDHKTAGGNGKSKAMMAEIDSLPKESIEAVMLRKKEVENYDRLNTDS